MELPNHVTAILSILQTKALQKAAKRVPGHVWAFTKAELETAARPTRVARSLRMALWRMASLDLNRTKSIRLGDLARAAGCTYTHAYNLLTQNPEILAWVLFPATDLRIVSHYMVSELIEQMHAIVDLPFQDESGKLIAQHVTLKLKVLRALFPYKPPLG